MNIKIMKALTVILGTLCIVSLAFGGPMDPPPGSPSEYGTANLQDIYHRLTAGDISRSATNPQLPTHAPGGGPITYTINEVMAACPEPTDNPATAQDVLNGKIFWSLNGEVRDGRPLWGKTTGARLLGLQSSGWDNECFESDHLLSSDIYRVKCSAISPEEIHVGQDGNPLPNRLGYKFDFGYKYSYSKLYSNGLSVFAPRFQMNMQKLDTSQGDGTVTDLLTGLTWTRSLNCMIGPLRVPSLVKWDQAVKWASGMWNGGCNGEIRDDSSPGDWRVPTVRELMSLVDFSGYDNKPGLTYPNEDPNNLQDMLPLTQCRPGNRTTSSSDASKCLITKIPSVTGDDAAYPFRGISPITELWSSTTYAFDPIYAWKLVLGPDAGVLLAKHSKTHQASYLLVRETRD